MNRCKRMVVMAFGLRGDRMESALNGNQGECSGVRGACGCSHAEILLLQKMPDPLMVVVSHSPCLECAKALVGAGVKEVVYLTAYRLRDGIEYLTRNDVCVRQVGG